MQRSFCVERIRACSITSIPYSGAGMQLCFALGVPVPCSIKFPITQVSEISMFLVIDHSVVNVLRATKSHRYN